MKSVVWSWRFVVFYAFWRTFYRIWWENADMHVWFSCLRSAGCLPLWSSWAFTFLLMRAKFRWSKAARKSRLQGCGSRIRRRWTPLGLPGAFGALGSRTTPSGYPAGPSSGPFLSEFSMRFLIPSQKWVLSNFNDLKWLLTSSTSQMVLQCRLFLSQVLCPWMAAVQSKHTILLRCPSPVDVH